MNVLPKTLWNTSRMSVTLLCAAIAVGCAPTRDSDLDVGNVSSLVASADTVYENGVLHSGWRNWSWNVTGGEAESTNDNGEALRVLSTRTTQPWGGLALVRRSPGPINISRSLTIVIRAAQSQTVYLSVQSGSTVSPLAPATITSAWSTITLEPSELLVDAPSFDRVNVQGSEEGQTFEVARVELGSPATSALPPLPTTPFAFNAGSVTKIGDHSVFVPENYSTDHSVPTQLFVWMHGCGGVAECDVWNVSARGSQDWITLSVGGRDGQCWNVDRDGALVLGAIEGVRNRLRIDPSRVVLGGYSSGGDLAYRVAFEHPELFSGILVSNTAPFTDSGASARGLAQAATIRVPIVQVAHLGDTTYPIAEVRSQIEELRSAGYRVALVERAGPHFEADGLDYGTNYDTRTYLLPVLSAF